MDPTARLVRPKARSQGLTVQELDAELMVYDESGKRAHCLNATAARVWRYCDGATTVSAMAARLGTDAGTPVDDDIVLFALSELSDRDLLERPVRAVGHGALNRRQALMRLGATAGILLPMITSLVAPTSAAAQSGSSGASSSGATSSSATSSGASSSGATSSSATSSGQVSSSGQTSSSGQVSSSG